MKKILLISTLISLQFSLFSQNEDWRPIRTDGRYLYDDFRTIRIDSVIAKGDSTHLFGFYEANLTDNYCYTPFGTAWFGKEIINTPNNTLIVNRFLDTLNISTQQSGAWVFYKSDTLTIMANVKEAKEMAFLDQTDSVKVISLTHSSNVEYPEEVIISKNFGLVKAFNLGKFPDLSQDTYDMDNFFIAELRGIEKTKSGIQPLNTKEIFDFNEGDEFHTLSQNWDFYDTSYQAKKINRIIEVNYTNDSTEVEVEICKNDGKVSEIWKYPNSSTLDREPWESQFHEENNVFYSYMEITDRGIVKGYPNLWLSEYDEGCYGFLHADKKKSQNTSFIRTSGYYIKGLGGPYHYFMGISSASRHELVYYKKGDSTWGIPYNCDSIMSVPENTTNTNILVYPNPAHDQFTIKFQNSIPEGYLVLYNATGKKLKTEILMERSTTVVLENNITGPLFYQVIANSKILKSGILLRH